MLKQRLMTFFIIALITICPALATASVQLDFASSVGGSTGSLYLGADNHMYFSFGSMVLLGASGTALEGAYMELSDLRIDSKAEDYSNPFLNSALYNTTMAGPSPEMRLYTADNQLIMTAFLEMNSLLTLGTSVFIGLGMDYEVSGIQLFGFDNNLVPSALQPFIDAGIADIKIELSKAGTDFTSFIDSKNGIGNIQVTTTLTAVPEPGAVALFAFGAVWFVKRFRKN
ncbi:MAG: PEP-CTERM sorting domain-containing protein [Candidatus Auribacterota bacterium]|jgi:hypothetical protein|nr:PEP-CTERM sorting domain-containing protein [Candidatus Auribacterota bacterium]